jgi:HK97 family phage major capsid protein
MEAKDLDSIAESVRTFTDATTNNQKETAARLLAIEQKMTAPRGGDFGGGQQSIGELLVASEGFKALQKGARNTGQIAVGSFHKTALVNATGQNQPLVQDYRRPGVVIPGGVQRLTVRDLLPSYPTSSNLVQFTRETAFTNNAAPQTGGSPNSGENIAKAESAATYDLTGAAVQTVAHFIPVSRQLMDDAAGFQAYISNRMTYFLKLEEETQLLSGDGSGNNLSGLIHNATAFDTSESNVADTMIDVVQKAITQAENESNLPCDAIVLNNLDWATIQRIKTTTNEYVFADPHNIAAPRLWGLPVVGTKSMPRNQGLVGNFAMGAAIWDRNDATVEISREHSDYFVKNMLAVLAEERLALTVFAPLAFCYFGFPFGS